MPEPQRFDLSGGQRGTFALLALVAIAMVGAGIATANGIAIALGGFFVLLAAYIGWQAFAPKGAYLIDADGFRHVRGDEVLLEVPWAQVKALHVIAAQPRTGGFEQLGFDVTDVAQVTGARRYRNTRRFTGHDILVNLGPVSGRSGNAAEAARAAWAAAARG